MNMLSRRGKIRGSGTALLAWVSALAAGLWLSLPLGILAQAETSPPPSKPTRSLALDQ